MKQDNVDSEVDEEKNALLANKELSDEARGRACKPITGGTRGTDHYFFFLPFGGLVFGYFTRYPRCERDSLPLGRLLHSVSKDPSVTVPTHCGKRGGPWIDSNALPSSFLVFLPKFLWNAKDGSDWRDEISLIFVTVGTIDGLLPRWDL